VPHDLPVLELARGRAAVPLLDPDDAPAEPDALAQYERSAQCRTRRRDGVDAGPRRAAGCRSSLFRGCRQRAAQRRLAAGRAPPRRRLTAGCAAAERFAGRSLRQALAAEGFVLGRFAIFHKPDDEQRAVLSAASLSRPGTFDVETMDSQHYGGLSLFAVLPDRSRAQAFDELIVAARNLNERLCGSCRRAGEPVDSARIALLRER